MKYLKYFLLLLLLAFNHATAITQDSTEIVAPDPLSDTEVSILTIRSGDELYTTFGHSAIRIFNPNLKIDHVYNYGLFSFNTPNFYPKFMKGQLPYYVARTSMKYFLLEYNDEKRSVFEQKLLLDNHKKKQVISFLENNIKKENREYAYDFFFDNCATRLVDIYSMVGDSVVYTNDVVDKTFRDLLKDNLHSLPWSEFGIDLVIGSRADRKTNRRDQMFLPEYVKKNLTHAMIADNGAKKLLADKSYIVLDFEKEDKQRKENAPAWPLFVMLGFLALIGVVNYFLPKKARPFNRLFLNLAGVMGCFLLFMWFGTNHGATRDNWNVLWLNPFLLLFANFKSLRTKPVKWVLTALLIIAGINCMVTILPQFYHLAFLPLILAIGIAIYNLEKES